MARAGMPAAAAAAVTSGSLAAPSSIEYSVCTCRCTKESDGGVLTGGGAPQWSRLPVAGEAAGDRRGRPAVRTGGGTGLRRYGLGRYGLGRCSDPRTANGLLRGSDRTCLRTAGPIHEGPPAPHHSPARGGSLQGAAQSRRRIVTCAMPASSYSSPTAL